jgi:amidohydrolase
LNENGYKVTKPAYGLETALEARSGSGGRLVNFNAEYDALPGLGHACGHNLIATASVTAFLALSAALKELKVPGRTQLLGTPAEESGGGKIALLRAGAYEGVNVSLMAHPGPTVPSKEGFTGTAGLHTIAHLGIDATFRGRSAHAGINPWNGSNALDALVCAYNNISVLRQQMKPDARVHGCILEAPKVANIIPDLTKVGYSIRSPNAKDVEELGRKVKNCLQAGALATDCQVTFEE